MGESWPWRRIWRWRRADGGNQVAVKESWRGGGELAVVESWQWWMVGDTCLTISLAGCADFTVSYFHFHFPANKSVQKGEVESDPRAGYLFQRSSVPPRSPLHYQLENGGAITRATGTLHVVNTPTKPDGGGGGIWGGTVVSVSITQVDQTEDARLGL